MYEFIDKNGNISANAANVIVIDKYGLVKQVSTGGGGSPTGPAGGDLSGTYPNPSVVWANGQPTYDLVYYPLPTGTVSQYIDGTGAFQTFPTIPPGSPLTTKGDLYTFSTLDTRLPVGLDTQVLLADSSTATGLKWGTNTAPTPLGYYGAWQTDATQTAVVNNTGYAMKFTIADVTPNGISIVNNGSGDPTRITFANTGIYNIQFSSQFQNIDNAEHDVTIWLRLNGTDVAGSSGFVQVPKRRAAGAGNEGHVIAAWNYVLSVVAGEYYEITWSTTDATHVTMQFYAAGSPPPSAASVIMTVTQQAGIMAGTGITALNSLTAAAQTFVNDTNVTIVSSGTTHTITWAGTLADSRIASSTTWNNKLNDILLSDMSINMPVNAAASINNVVGAALTVSNGPTTRTIADTNLFTRTTRTALETTAVAANVSSFRQTGGFTINTGFKVAFKFGASTGATNSNVRYSMGVFTAGFIVTNVDPTTFINCAAFARIDGNNNWQFIHNDATGTATAIDLGASFPANTVSTDMYYGVIETVSANIKYTLTRLNTGATTTGTVSSNLVAVSTLLGLCAGCSNNANAAICALDFGGMQLIKFT